MPKYSIVLPVYNQEKQIAATVEAYCKELEGSGWSCEIILAVNGSRDRSLQVCQFLSGKYPMVRVVSAAQKGWGTAVRLGIKEARGEAVCFTNSSRTQPEDLRKFLECAEKNPDSVIKATRKVRENLSRRIGSLLYNFECRTLFGIKYGDINGTPKIFPKKYEKLLKLSRNDDLIDLEFLALCNKNNYPIVEVPVFSCKRLGGKSTTGLKTAFRLYSGAFLLWLNRRKINL